MAEGVYSDALAVAVVLIAAVADLHHRMNTIELPTMMSWCPDLTHCSFSRPYRYKSAAKL